MMNEKILLVGDKRICPQVAYVMNWQNYAMVERLTAENIDQYRDYKIVVCDFKRKRKKLVKIKDKVLNISYLDDVCRRLDKEPSLLTNEFTEVWTFGRRVLARIKNGEFGLAIVRRLKRHFTLRSYRIINRLPVESLKLSELLIKVLNSKPTNIDCDRLENNCEINALGQMTCCCGIRLPFGQIMSDGDLSSYNNFRARIIKLSSINRSYCLCDQQKCLFAIYTPQINTTLKPLPKHIVPQFLGINTDRACNLKCPMCRTQYLPGNAQTDAVVEKIHTALCKAGWLKTQAISLAGMGEIFYSEPYRALLSSGVLLPKQLYIVSNGTLFNQANWDLIKGRYQYNSVAISVDAATASTYLTLRGGDFNLLLQNLTLIKSLRLKGEINEFRLNFVVQSGNYREILAFVTLAKKLLVDKVLFTHLNNYGAFNNKAYRQNSLILRNGCLRRDLYAILQDPLLRDPIVDINAFYPYLVNSAKRYDKKRK